VPGDPLFGCFGHLNENKRVPQLLRAFGDFERTHPDARLLLVGAEAPGFRLLAEVPDGVIREPYVEEDRLMRLIAACDAVVLLRAPTMGETSGSAIRTLSLGKPLVVSDLGWFAELPDDVALKIPVGDGEEEALADALETLAVTVTRERMREAALAYVRDVHGLDHVADLYVAALEQAAGSAAVEAAVLQDVAAAAAATGADVDTIAPDLRELGLASAATVPVSVTGSRRLPPLPMWLWLGALYAVAVAVILTLALRIKSPWIMVDELIYSDTARSIADGAGFSVRGAPAQHGYVYPLLLSIAYFAADRVTDAYAIARVLNALVMCSVVFPVYLLARRVVRPGAAFAAAALAVAAPPLVYAGTLMTENVFYPLFAWLCLALVAALERPTLRAQLVLLALCALAFLTRAQAVALVAAALTAPLVLAWIERGRPRRLGAFKPLYAIVAAGAVLVVVVEAALGNSPLHVLGGYSETGSASYRFWPALKWVVLHLAGLDLATWVLPAAAFVVVVASARHLDRPLRVFAAASAPLVAWLVLVVGVFASHYSLRIEERTLFYVTPLLLIALFAWIERGQPRPPRATVAGAVVAVALAGALPFTSLLNESAESDSPFLQPWWYLGESWTGRATVSLVAVVTALALGAAFLWLSPRFAPWLPALVAAGFVATWLPLQAWPHGYPQASLHQYEAAVAAGTSWIDRAAGTDAKVAALYSGGSQIRYWIDEFWNRSIRRVYGLDDAELSGGMPQTQVHVDRESGVLVDEKNKPIDADYVLADVSAEVAGTRVAADPPHGLVLYRVQRPARMLTRITGWYGPPDGWTGPRVTWSRAQCAGGTLRVPISTDTGLFKGVVQRIRINGASTETLRPTETKTLAIPLRPRDGTCSVTLEITPSRVPADFPALHISDTRLLGVHAQRFTYVPRP
jgi:hypothetical protein